MYGLVFTGRECAVWKSVHWGCNFFLFVIEIDQSQMSDGKIASKGNMLLIAR